jgi:hypothetical protein
METTATTDLPGILAELESLNQRIDRIISRPGYEGDTARASMLRKLQTRRRALSAAAAAAPAGRCAK